MDKNEMITIEISQTYQAINGDQEVERSPNHMYRVAWLAHSGARADTNPAQQSN